MAVDRGRTLDHLGHAHQSSLRVSSADTRLMRLNSNLLAVVLRTKTADQPDNRLTAHYTDRRSFGAVCDVLVVNDGYSDVYWPIHNVQVTPDRPSGLDNYGESLPRGCTSYVNGEPYSTSGASQDVKDLDGDWCIVSFLGGNERAPYISRWWPHTRNTFDPQTIGYGSPDSTGQGRALDQTLNGKFRHFSRINGVEYVVTPRGDIFLSTHYAGSDIKPNPENITKKGRFIREEAPTKGGGIRVNVKTNQALELNWSPQEDGIGLYEAFDPSLPQTNPQPQRPSKSGARSATFVNIRNSLVSFEVPTLFNVRSSSAVQLESLGNTDIIVGGTHRLQCIGNSFLTSEDSTVISTAVNLDITADGGMITIEAQETSTNANSASVGVTVRTGTGLLLLEAQNADIEITAPEKEIKVTAKETVTIYSIENDVELLGDQILLGHRAVHPVVFGDSLQLALAELLLALNTFAATCVTAPPGNVPPAIALATAVTKFQLDYEDAKSQVVLVA